MVSSPKDQKQGDSTEKQADPISIYNQLDHRHKQKSAYQKIVFSATKDICLLYYLQKAKEVRI